MDERKQMPMLGPSHISVLDVYLNGFFSSLPQVASKVESESKGEVTLVPAEMQSVEPALQAKRSKTLLFVLVGLIAVVALGLGSLSAIGGSVLYYRTPSEIAAADPGVAVRLAGELVKASVAKDEQGGTTFQMTDGKSVINVIYRGGATTALTTAAKPGTQMVAEGRLGPDGTFQATNLLAKCPSKFATASPVAQSTSTS